ncbi:MAG TPA: hypothetical protein ENG83_09530 [Nitrospirae bacterium]|nr:hypothetical protein [Nitrospirota bacterium]HDY99840.1 hypothetical protein [Nitrospirota bacterium]
MKLLHYDYSYLPVVMNYTNAVFGTLTIIPAFFLIRQLFKNSTIAFCAVLALIFAPSFYQSTIMGFPHLIAFFFLLVSLSLYLSGLDCNRKSRVYLLMFLSSVFLTVAFLFKSDYVLAAGIYIGFLFMRKVRDKGKITGAFLIIFISGVLFLLIRDLILGPGSGTTMSKEGLSKWYDYSLIIPTNLTYLIRQTSPIAFGAGIVTFCLGIISFLFYIVKRRLDVLIFIVSWAAVPTLFWLIMIGNNARHNMFTILPLLVIIVIFFYEKAPRYVVVLTCLLILGNFLVTSPSSSILRPSGNLFKSNALLKERMIKFRSSAKDIANINEDKIAVLGYFHNPHVVFEIMRSVPSYEAVKIGREDYRIKTGNKEYLFIYFVVVKPDDIEDIKKGIDYISNKYNLDNYVFVSATYDLQSLNNSGLKTKSVDIIKKSTL